MDTVGWRLDWKNELKTIGQLVWIFQLSKTMEFWNGLVLLYLYRICRFLVLFLKSSFSKGAENRSNFFNFENLSIAPPLICIIVCGGREGDKRWGIIFLLLIYPKLIKLLLSLQSMNIWYLAIEHHEYE